MNEMSDNSCPNFPHRKNGMRGGIVAMRDSIYITLIFKVHTRGNPKQYTVKKINIIQMI